MHTNIELKYEKLDSIENGIKVDFVGDLDTTNINSIIEELLKLVEKDGYKVIVADFEKLRYVNSTGIGVLLHFNKVVGDNDGKLFLININDNVYEIMNIIGATAVLEIFDSLDDVIEYL